MKIGIITILKVGNYGAELQAYATQAIIKKLGYDAQIIDYLFYKNPNHRRNKISRPLFKMGIKKRLSEKIYPIYTYIKELGAKQNSLRKSRFELFHQKYTSLSTTFRSMPELYANCPDYDVYIVGSDQVWNPGVYSSLKPYFLDFAPVGKPRIAYASSFGVGTLPDGTQKTYKQYLSLFDYIGVRESSGVGIINALGLKAEHVLDPTLLLTRNDWKTVSTEYQGLPSNYIAVYELTPSTYLKQIALEVSAKLKLPIVRICKSAGKEDDASINILDAGPSEFVGIIMHASFVITNSFHGTAFAINLGIPFYTITPNRKDNNSRQISLLNLMGLKNRNLRDGELLPQEIGMDFSKTKEILDIERQKSIKFLTKAINGNKA